MKVDFIPETKPKLAAVNLSGLIAAAFICSKYLAKPFLGEDKALEEKVRRDKALEAYQAAKAKYMSDLTKLLDRIKTKAPDEDYDEYSDEDYDEYSDEDYDEYSDEDSE